MCMCVCVCLCVWIGECASAHADGPGVVEFPGD